MIGAYTLTIPFSSTTSNYALHLTNVYAPSNNGETDAFLDELRNICPQPCPWIMVGDFNLTRSPANKNTAGLNWALASKFNSIIDKLALMELPLLDRLYTWSNKRASPTLAHLDRAFIRTDFCSKFPNAFLSSRLGNPFDHTPIVVTIPTSLPKTHLFRFENAWLKNPTFLPSVCRLGHIVG